MSLSNLAHSSRGATPILSVLRVPGWILMSLLNLAQSSKSPGQVPPQRRPLWGGGEVGSLRSIIGVKHSTPLLSKRRVARTWPPIEGAEVLSENGAA